MQCSLRGQRSSISPPSSLSVAVRCWMWGRSPPSSVCWSRVTSSGSDQCQEMVLLATITTWAIRHMKALGVSEVKLTEFRKSEGRVHLEYACPEWHSSFTVAQSRLLDRAQRVAMAAITGWWELSHTLQLLELGLDRLGPRRDLICERFAERTAWNSRHQDLFTPIGTNTGAQGTRYAELRARSGTYCKLTQPYLTWLFNQ